MKKCSSIILVCLASVFVGACLAGIGDGCDGGPVVANPFPDTLNFILRDDPYDILLRDPERPFVEHTNNDNFSLSAFSSDRQIIMERVITVGVTSGVLQLSTLNSGAVTISVTAIDGCDISAGDSFIAKVLLP